MTPRSPGSLNPLGIDLTFTFRWVRDDDGPELAAHIRRCWEEYPGCVLDVEKEETWLRAPAAEYEKNGGFFLVIEQQGSIVACIGLKPGENGSAEPKSLYVAKHMRKLGLGTFLMGLMEQYARAIGIRRLCSWSDTRFTTAHRLYANLGYTKTGRTRDLHDLSNTTEYEFFKDL